MNVLVKISDVSCYLPARVVSNEEVEQRVIFNGEHLASGILERLFGIKERRFAAEGEQVSDLAATAARPIVEKYGADHFDMLIFAAASGDLIEPATANIIQQKLGLTCPAMDIKNACNSFVSGIQTASAFVMSGMYRHVLVVNGEKLSEVINFTPKDSASFSQSVASYSLGDAGAAALITQSTNGRGIVYQKFITIGEHWRLCMVEGGGSMRIRDMDAYYFQGQTSELRNVVLPNGTRFARECLKEAGWVSEDIKWVFTHQISHQTVQAVAETFGVAKETVINVFPFTGNAAAASIPLAMDYALQRGMLQEGDKIVLLGLAAGISISVQLVVW